jgi:hypothetical protein
MSSSFKICAHARCCMSSNSHLPAQLTNVPPTFHHHQKAFEKFFSMILTSLCLPLRQFGCYSECAAQTFGSHNFCMQAGDLNGHSMTFCPYLLAPWLCAPKPRWPAASQVSKQNITHAKTAFQTERHKLQMTSSHLGPAIYQCNSYRARPSETLQQGPHLNPQDGINKKCGRQRS